MRTREVIKLAANSHNVFPTDPELEKAEELKREIYSKVFRPNLMTGAKELIALLIDRGCRLAIVTGTAEASARAVIRALDAESSIKVVISHDSGILLKPHPAPYIKAAIQLSIEPRQCLAIENAPAGVTSAVAAGLRCLAVASYLEKADLQEADRVFGSLLELNSWLSGRSTRDSQGNWLL
jgi:beta-phosphoglucomutase